MARRPRCARPASRSCPPRSCIEGDDVFYEKRCKAHGVQKTLISSDARYYRWQRDFLKPGDRPQALQSRTEFGCPYDCGLCPDHEQHSCMAIVEINDVCNLTCPVCFADSSPKRTRTSADWQTIERMFDALVESEGEPDLVQISGGEPTLHPQILDIVRLAQVEADPPCDDQHQRRPDRAGPRIRRRARRDEDRARDLSAVRLAAPRGAEGDPRRRSRPASAGRRWKTSSATTFRRRWSAS